MGMLLMGFFAFYNGWIYNDCFGLGLDVFGSRWNHTTLASPVRPYPFGLDPVWKITTNELQFSNSYKMKISVIIGITQMTLGVILKGANAVYFRKPLDFIFEFTPQLLFMASIFLYLIFMIMYKWCTDWDIINFDVAAGEGHTPPPLIQTLINFALSPGHVV